MPNANPPLSKSLRITGVVLSSLTVLFLLFSAAAKFLKPEGIEAVVLPLGWRMDQLTMLGIIQVACSLLYAIPQTAVLGAVLLTAYLGGAVATHVRVGQPFVIPVTLAIVMWLGLYLREPRLWLLSPIRRS